MVLGWEDSCATVAGVFLFVVHRQHRHSRNLRVRREKGPDVQHGAERNVPQIRRCAVITDNAVGEHGEGMRRVSEILARTLHADAATAIGMIHEHQFAPIGERFFQRWKLPRLGAEGFTFTFGIGGAWEQGHAEVERSDPLRKLGNSKRRS